MEKRNKILILYHSGAGSTKAMSEIFYMLLDKHLVDICSINMDYDYNTLKNYDLFIFAFPTYHCSPSTSIMDFVKNMPAFSKKKKAFAFTTCGLYSGNALREFIYECLKKGIVIGGYSIYRAPASDGALLLPPLSFMFQYEKNIAYKIKADIYKIEKMINTSHFKFSSPHLKLYTILNYPNKILGKAYRHKFKLVKEACTNCKKCVNECIRHSWVKGEEYPKYDVTNCEFCFHCIHHCPNEAITLSEKTRSKTKLNGIFYKNLKEDIISKLAKI